MVLAVKLKPFDVSSESSFSMETFVLMHDALSVRFVMIDFEKVAWDPVLRELSQSGHMTKCIVEYFEKVDQGNLEVPLK